MNTIALNNNYQLELPTSYVDVDDDEMEYVDGGWSGYVAARNAWGYISQKGVSRALAWSGITYRVVMQWASYSFTYACSVVGWQTAKIGATVGGVIGAVLATAGAAGLLYWLGSKRRYY